MHDKQREREVIGLRDSEAGFSLIDVCVTLFVCVVVIYALHSGTRTAMTTRRVVETNYQLQLFANDFVNRLRRVPFGNPGASPATAQQLDALFDADQDLGTVTLSQLVCPVNQDGHSFKLGGNDLNRTWRVRVTRDVNGDGDEFDDREARSDLMRLEIYYDNRLVVETLRAADPNLTSLDGGVNYITGTVPEIPPPTAGGPAPTPTPTPPPSGIEGEPPPPTDETDPGLLPAVEPETTAIGAPPPPTAPDETAARTTGNK